MPEPRHRVVALLASFGLLAFAAVGFGLMLSGV